MTDSRGVTGLHGESRLAYAKLNLSLRILAREQSGYHQIETIFCALRLADEIDVVLSDDDVVRLVVVGSADHGSDRVDLGPTEKNLAWRAATAYRAAVPGRGACITLTKRIPDGAGLGGGSSDAAAVLLALNTLHGRQLSSADLLRLGAQLGSDVPFFLTGAPLALAWGRGGRLLPLAPLPAATVLLVAPAEKVPTADAYAALAHTREQGRAGPDAYDPAQPALVRPPASWREAGDMAVNDFEEIVFQRLPVLAALRATLADAGARVARLTGTGSTVFGVFEDPHAAGQARRVIEDRFTEVRTITTATLGVDDERAA